MKILLSSMPIDQFFTEPMGLFVFSDLFPPHRETGRVDFRLSGVISRWLRQGMVDPTAAEPVPFAPGSGAVFPAIVIAGAGGFEKLAPKTIETAIAAAVSTLFQIDSPSFGLAARDLRIKNVPARDHAEAIMNGLRKAVLGTGVKEPRWIRLHWDEDEVDLMVQELKRQRRYHRETKDWRVEREPLDFEWLGLEATLEDSNSSIGELE